MQPQKTTNPLKIKIASESFFYPLYLLVSAKVRYWEDAEINGKCDRDGSLIPLKFEDFWKPVIELSTGRVLDWPIGTTADIHYKVCDEGEYHLEDVDKNVLTWSDYYVPDDLLANGEGYGDYIILKISADGFIENWKIPQLDAEDWE